MQESLPFEKLRTLLVRKEAQTSEKYGTYPWNRTVEELLSCGVVAINKPKGPTSHQVTAYAKHILQASRAGHSGTLDPRVTGVLPIAFNRATRVVQYLLLSGKEYITLMHLHKPVDEYSLRKVLHQFTGEIKQLPPQKSAVKRQLRKRTVYYLTLLEMKGQDVLLKVGSQAGTYIRKLCHDIGEELGCGAHMAELVRTKAGPFLLEDATTLQDLADALYYWKQEGNDAYLRELILPIEQAVRHLPKIWVFDTSVDALCHGAYLGVPGIAKLHSDIEYDDMVAVMTLKNELICVGKAQMTSQEMLTTSKGIAASLDAVFMLPGTYPKINKKV